MAYGYKARLISTIVDLFMLKILIEGYKARLISTIVDKRRNNIRLGVAIKPD